MRKIRIVFIAMLLAYMPLAGSLAHAQGYANDQYQYQSDAYEPYTGEQLDNLLAPVALYPDPLLAQLLIAATFPDQIQDAANWVRSYGANNPGIDDQPWDVSVKAVAHYPAVLYMMNDKLDWTTAVGQAYANQSTDTMASIQNLRGLARSEGNLFSTPQQQVIVDGGYIEIVPAEPQYIFVPTYDPGVIYSRRVYTGTGFGGFFSFGSGFAIGAWLNYDLDWGHRRVIYNGWQGGGWRDRSRPYVHVTNVYVNNRYQNVVVNRTVTNRPVNYGNVNQFNSVHRDVRFDNRTRSNGRPGGQGNNGPNRNGGAVQPSQPQRSNDNFNRDRGANQTPPSAPQQSPQVPRQNDNTDRGRVNGSGGRQNQTPPAAVQPSQPQRPNDNFNRDRGANQPPPSAPQPAPQVPRQENGGNDRGRQNQAPPRAESAKPTPPAPAAPAAAPRQGNQPTGRADRNDKDNKDNKDRGH